MAGVAVDRYGFVYDRLTPPATGLSGLSVAALWRRTNHQSTSPGEVSSRLLFPCCSSPFYHALQREAMTRVGWRWQKHRWRSTHRHGTCDGSAQGAQPQGMLGEYYLNSQVYTDCVVAYEDLYLCLVNSTIWCTTSVTYIQTITIRLLN